VRLEDASDNAPASSASADTGSASASSSATSSTESATNNTAMLPTSASHSPTVRTTKPAAAPSAVRAADAAAAATEEGQLLEALLGKGRRSGGLVASAMSHEAIMQQGEAGPYGTSLHLVFHQSLLAASYFVGSCMRAFRGIARLFSPFPPMPRTVSAISASFVEREAAEIARRAALALRQSVGASGPGVSPAPDRRNVAQLTWTGRAGKRGAPTNAATAAVARRLARPALGPDGTPTAASSARRPRRTVDGDSGFGEDAYLDEESLGWRPPPRTASAPLGATGLRARPLQDPMPLPPLPHARPPQARPPPTPSPSPSPPHASTQQAPAPAASPTTVPASSSAPTSQPSPLQQQQARPLSSPRPQQPPPVTPATGAAPTPALAPRLASLANSGMAPVPPPLFMPTPGGPTPPPLFFSTAGTPTASTAPVPEDASSSPPPFAGLRRFGTIINPHAGLFFAPPPPLVLPQLPTPVYFPPLPVVEAPPIPPPPFSDAPVRMARMRAFLSSMRPHPPATSPLPDSSPSPSLSPSSSPLASASPPPPAGVAGAGGGERGPEQLDSASLLRTLQARQAAAVARPTGGSGAGAGGDVLKQAEARELVERLYNHLVAAGGRSTSQALVATFGGPRGVRGKAGLALLRSLLKEIAVFKREAGSGVGVWELRPELVPDVEAGKGAAGSRRRGDGRADEVTDEGEEEEEEDGGENQ